jgi:hypothetical protein
MTANLHHLAFPAEVLRRGFWLYVWKITISNDVVHYVGRTGDSSSLKAQSPLSRVASHLGPNKNANALKRHLAKTNIEISDCERFEFISYGPLFEEAANERDHRHRRGAIHALERDLCEGMRNAGYHVLNSVPCRFPSDAKAWERVRAAFAVHFPKLNSDQFVQ